MKKNKIKKVLDEIRGRNETILRRKITYYENKQKDYNKIVGDNKAYGLSILDEQIRLALVGDIFDEIDLKLGL